jgi:hypothetical protein
MKTLAITSGCDAVNYWPRWQHDARSDGSIHRARAGGQQLPLFSDAYFDDAAANHPFFRFIQKMKEWGITAGCTATSYCHDNNTTRGQMGVFMIRGFDTPR